MASEHAHGCLRSAACADSAQRRSSGSQSGSAFGSSISVRTRSTSPSRIASLFGTWLYSDMAWTPSSWPRRRIEMASRPSRSARSAAAARMRSRESGREGAGTLSSLRCRSNLRRMSTMNAISPEGYGPPEKLQPRQVPVPAPGTGEVLIRVRAASVNPLDWHHVRGEPFVLRAMTGMRRPKQPGLGADAAGVVDSVGEGVTDLRPGDEGFGIAHGAFAEYAVGDQTKLALKPAHLTFEQAAALPIAGTTALQALSEHGGVEGGNRGLILGAAGGVGTFAVQLAKAMGAEVTAVCGTGGVALVESLGAVRVIDYTKEPVTETTERYDVVFQVSGDYGLRELGRLVVPGGTLVIVGSGVGRDSRFSIFGPLWRLALAQVVARVQRRRIVTFVAKTRTASLQTLAEHTAAGTVTPLLERTYPLAQAGEALTHIENGHAHGKTVLTI